MGAPAPQAQTAADGFRPIGQVMRDLKSIDQEIINNHRRRKALIEELDAIGKAATQYAETAQCATLPSFS